MAILKHLSSKNRNYGKALEYLVYQHNEYTQKPILDGSGNMQLRKEYYLDGLNCHPLTFSKECEILNAQYHKNQSAGEIKSHHYIISFDPRDAKAGLTGEKAQALGLEFAKKYFDGHQALVCTHMDGHNESGNIHVHIVINSLRKNDVEHQDFMERDYDHRAGYKHHQTRKYLTAMQEGLMQICEREHLHQVDLLSPAADNITDREYRLVQRRQMEETDDSGSSARAPIDAPNRFQSQKQYLREAIREISSYAKSPEEFGNDLQKYYGIAFKISRGRFSYLHPDRQKYMTGRTLGNDYTEQYLLPLFAGNKKAGRTREQFLADQQQHSMERSSHMSTDTHIADDRPAYDPSYDYSADPVAAFRFRTKLRLVVDLQTCAKAQASRAYARKVKLSNLQQMAQTICYVQEHHFGSIEELLQEKDSTLAVIDKLSNSIDKTNQQISDALNARPGLDASDPDFNQLLQIRKSLQTNQRNLKKYLRELQVAHTNVDSILKQEPQKKLYKENVQDR